MDLAQWSDHRLTDAEMYQLLINFRWMLITIRAWRVTFHSAKLVMVNDVLGAR